MAFGQLGGINAEFAGGGARALAMGGAFIGLADDATASEFNPAGVWQLRRPEFAFQVIASVDEHPVGVTRILPTGIVNQFEEETDRYWVPSFISYVHPTEHFTLALSEFTNVYFDRSGRSPNSGARTRESARNYAFGLTACAAPWDRFSIGATLRYNRFEFEYDTPDAEAYFEDEAFTVNAGVLWRPKRWFAIGAVYKSAQKLEGTYHYNANRFPVDTELPDTFGVGVAISPGDAWRIVMDVDRIRWSRFDAYTDDDLVRDDVWRYHAGVEWYAGSWRDAAFFLRGGASYEEPSEFRYTGPNSGFRTLTNDRREALTHASMGVGVARPGYQLDAGVDLTLERGFDLIFSSVWYF